MRAVVILAVLLASVATARAQDAALGFEHVVHDGQITVAGGSVPACDACHALDAKGRLRGAPGHAACFGACHGAAPAKLPKAGSQTKMKKKGRAAATTSYAIADDQARVCSACHAPAALAALTATGARPPVPFPPYLVDNDYGLALSHAAHDDAPCATCHPAIAGDKPPARPHDRCAGCHLAPAEAATPKLSACGTCHVPAYGPARGPTLFFGVFALRDGFSHAGHRQRAPAADCRGCHVAMLGASGGDLPAPRTQDCAGCHDGKAAFATTEACNRCHVAAPTETYKLELTIRRFSHDDHRAVLPDGACAGCHQLDARGEAPSPGHAACADAACHAADFASTTPVTCGACHVAIEPWRPLRADAQPAVTTEFGAAMPHREHASLGLTCAGCHALEAGDRDLRPPRGHVSCSGAACHRRDEGPAPRLDACSDCHRAGLVTSRDRDRRAARWSVRARFEHAPHASASCEGCHDQVWQQDGAIPTPAKDTCRGCHDGGAAFKMTGHGCARCHGR